MSLILYAVQKFATAEDRDCPLPVVAHRGKAGVRQAVESEEIIYFVGERDDLRAVIEDVRNGLDFFDAEHFAGRVVWSVENENLCLLP